MELFVLRLKKTWYVSAILGLFTVLCIGLFFFGGDHSEPFHYNKPSESGDKHQARDEYLRFRLGGSKDSYIKREYDSLRLDAAQSRLVLQDNRGSEEVIAEGKLRGTWIERGAQNQSGRVIISEVLESKDLVVLGTDGGSIISGPLSGNSFTIHNNNFNMIAKAIHAFEKGNGFRIVVLTDHGVYYTDDEGEIWNKSYDDQMVTSTLSRTNNQLYAVTHSGQVVLSKDLGESFEVLGTVAEVNGKYAMWTARYDDGDVFLLAQGTVYSVSEQTIAEIGAIDKSSTRIAISGDNRKGNSTLYALYKGKPGSSLYKSSDQGKTWTSVGQTPTGMFRPNSFFSATESLLYTGGMECYRSEDGGVSWTKLNSWKDYYANSGGDPEKMLHADITEIRTYIDKSGSRFSLISTDGGTYSTYDDKNYKNITLHGVRNNMYYDVCSRWDSPDIIMAGSQDQGAQISKPGSGNGEILDFTQYVAGDQGSYSSSDSGKSVWFMYVMGLLYYHPNTLNSSAVSVGKPSNTDSYLWLPPTMADPQQPNIVYTGGTYLYKTVYENGAAKHSKYSKHAFGTHITDIAVSPIDHNHWYITTAGKQLYYSSDYGKNWVLKSTNIPSNHLLVGQAVVPDNLTLGKIYVAGNGNGSDAVFVSDDHGASFSATGEGVPTTAVLDMTMSNDNKYLFAAAYDAAYVYIVEENRWYNLTGLTGPDVPYFAVEYVPTIQTARFATHGRGIFDFKINTGPVAITKNQKLEIDPITFTKVHDRFVITTPKGGEYRLEILTVSGKVLYRKMVSLSSGENSITLPDLAHQNLILTISDDNVRILKRIHL